ncbi:flagellar hook basal-body protein [bacterium]|jgi:flagellar hook protein FlgE|nr:flagellar hook basal-body protein [bacterium]
MFETLSMLENSIVAFSDAMRVLAADVQNFQSNGYKQTRYTFTSIYSDAIARVGTASTGTAGSSNVQSFAAGVMLLPMGLDFSQGGLQAGGRLNAAVSGQGLFTMKPENSSNFVYTRASDFVFAADGTLVDVYGRKVMGFKRTNGTTDTSNMTEIKLDPDTVDLSDVGFEDDGLLVTNFNARKTARENDETVPEGEELFQLALADVPNPSSLESVVGNAYKTTINSGEPARYGVAGQASFGDVVGATVESSNVNPAETTIVGIQLQRGYNIVQSALTMINKMLTSFTSAVNS